MMHSLVFALLLSIIVIMWPLRREAQRFSRRWWKLLAFYFLLTASHGFIDAFTDGGLGIAFFAPFDSARHFMPWTPIAVSPLGLEYMFSAYGAQVMISELLWIWLPVGAVAASAIIFRRMGSRHHGIKASRDHV